eukprot:1910432-Amphidinium_carterae.1
MARSLLCARVDLKSLSTSADHLHVGPSARRGYGVRVCERFMRGAQTRSASLMHGISTQRSRARLVQADFPVGIYCAAATDPRI